MNWPEPDKDDGIVVREMKENPDSPEWQKCYDFLCALIKRIFGGSCPDNIKEDVVQVAITKVFQSLGTFSCTSPLKNWLRVILKNTVRDFLRKGKSENNISLDASQDDANEEGYEIGIERTPEDLCIIHETMDEAVAGYREWLKKESPKNAERDFEIWKRYVLQGQEAKHVADCLKINKQTVYRIKRAAEEHFSQLRRKD